jgi:hypothetical protein
MSATTAGNLNIHLGVNAELIYYTATVAPLLILLGQKD